MQTYMTPARLGKFKGHVLANAAPQEKLCRVGRTISMPKNSSDTYVARRFLPYGATAGSPNVFYADGNGDRTAAMVASHLTTEGVTPTPETIVPVDVQCQIVELACLYGFNNKTYDLHEDDLVEETGKIIGDRVTLVNEAYIYGLLKAATTRYYGGTGVSRSTVNGTLTLPMLRKIARSLRANHAKDITRVLSASVKYDTEAVQAGFLVYVSTDLESAVRDLPNFTPAEKYASGTPMEHEIGKCEHFRFIACPDLVSVQNGGAAVGATGLYSTGGANIDVYQVIVMAADAFSQLAVRGVKGANGKNDASVLTPTLILPNETSKNDPLGQRGYYGCRWYKAGMIENNGWMAVAEVGTPAL